MAGVEPVHIYIIEGMSTSRRESGERLSTSEKARLVHVAFRYKDKRRSDGFEGARVECRVRRRRRGRRTKGKVRRGSGRGKESQTEGGYLFVHGV